jgi:hypothetical protein
MGYALSERSVWDVATIDESGVLAIVFLLGEQTTASETVGSRSNHRRDASPRRQYFIAFQKASFCNPPWVGLRRDIPFHTR